jgi:hypothetical protein
MMVKTASLPILGFMAILLNFRLRLLSKYVAAATYSSRMISGITSFFTAVYLLQAQLLGIWDFSAPCPNPLVIRKNPSSTLLAENEAPLQSTRK